MITKLEAFIKACKKNGLIFKYNPEKEIIKIKLDDGNEVILDKNLNIIKDNIK